MSKKQIFFMKGSFPGRAADVFRVALISNGLLKKPFSALCRHSAETGIQSFQCVLDSPFRGSEGKLGFSHILLI
jgi:hypothetical protein